MGRLWERTLAELQLTIGSAARGQFMLTVWAPKACNLAAAQVRAALKAGHHPTLDCHEIRIWVDSLVQIS